MSYSSSVQFTGASIMKILRCKYLLLAFCAISLVSCGKGADSGGSEGGSGAPFYAGKSEINAEEAASGGCLNVSRLAVLLKSLDPNLQALKVSTEFDMHSNRGIRNAFRLLTAFGSFMFEEEPVAEVTELVGYTQADCETLVFHPGDGTQEAFKIKEKAKHFIAAASESGKKVEVHWLSPQRIEVKLRYQAYDFPCTTRDAWVETNRIIDWSGNRPQLIEGNSKLSIDEDFLDLVAEAVGYNSNLLYQEAAVSDSGRVQRYLEVNRLMEMKSMPVRQSLLSCDGAVPEPPPESEPELPEEQPTPPAPTPGPGEPAA